MENSHQKVKPFGTYFQNKLGNQNISNQGNNKIKNQNNPSKSIFLSNIVQLTQEYDQGKTMTIQTNFNNEPIHELKQKSSSSRDEQTHLLKNNKFYTKFLNNFCNKSLNCLKLTFKNLYNKMTTQNVNVESSQISLMLQKLRKKRSKKLCLLPPPNQDSQSKRTLVLDLDQNLIYISLRKISRYDFCINANINGINKTLYVVKRFGLDAFLFQMKQFYEIIIFSSLYSELVEKIVQYIDPKKNISHFLSRQHCICINKQFFIKPLKDIGRDCKNLIMVDSHSISAALNPENLYRIQPFRGSTKDRKLLKLTYFLKHIASLKHLTEIIPIQLLRRQFQTKQIHINQRIKSKQNRPKFETQSNQSQYQRNISQMELEYQNQTSKQFVFNSRV